jgi:hypothetical protein
MIKTTAQTAWRQYLETELPIITKILNQRGYSLDEKQPHLTGERFLMQAMTTNSGRKFILLGHKDDARVVIKATRDKAGKDELQHERTCRNTLHQIDFAYDTFHAPREIDFFTDDEFLITVQEFIDQSSTFLDRPLLEQFDLSLQALITQEHARATTSKHFRLGARIFGIRNAPDYLKLFAGFKNYLSTQDTVDDVNQHIQNANEKIIANQTRIEQYCGFLTHTDFVPHNFRIKDNTLYLLDFSSLRFGNKHESWARFLNFMTLYNSELENALLKYIKDNRTHEEYESLQLMRIFRLGEIISYYVRSTDNSNGELKELNQTRVFFWNDVLKAELNDTRVSREIVATYQKTRDKLRSPEEKQRQVGLH